MAVDWIGFGYALLVSAGGIIGYVKAGMSEQKHILGFKVTDCKQTRRKLEVCNNRIQRKLIGATKQF